MRWPARLALSGLTMLALCSSASAQTAPATAEPPSALEVAHEGIELFDKSQWEAAYHRFAYAERREHSPVFVLYMGRCRAHQGRLLDAARLLKRVADEQVAGEAPAAWGNAVDDSKRELIELDARIPRVVLRPLPAETRLRTLNQDGHRLAASQLGVELSVDPGEHRFVAEDTTHRSALASFQIQEGQHLEIKLDFGQQPLASAGATRAKTGPTRARSKAPVRGRPDRLSYVLWIAGGVGSVLGAATGATALTESHAIGASCVDNHCLLSDRDRGRRASVLASVSTAAFAIGGAALLGGTVWFFLAPSDAKDSHPSAAMLGMTGRF